MLVSIILAIPLLAAAVPQTSTSCRNNFNGYCCDGSIISSDGSQYIDKLICCKGDPVGFGIDIDAASTCTAGSPESLIQQSTIPNGIINGGATIIILNGVTVTGGPTTTTPEISPQTLTAPATPPTGTGTAVQSSGAAVPAVTIPEWWVGIFAVWWRA
ncbi:hypothetical protein OPT61_g4266 [Boeremia exigua]|uniref:Uncharacterized protein n=1 Tax=Boeremia exigua TaxID=749465 RepID=A0ACC2IEL7_9PLEO|nr:hypothetical protein OPT61_g4266 [Boeremia exigua]